MTEPLFRSPELLSRDGSGLLVIDVQEKLLRAMPQPERLVWNIRRLVDGAQLLGVPVTATEQYPQGLGPTAAVLAERLPDRPAKRVFSCRECGEALEAFRRRGASQLLLAGIEAHVCVLQTALDLIAAGFRVYVAADAVASRHGLDYDLALRRLESSGAVLTTVETALFEWCETSTAAEFKRLSALVTEPPPA